MEIKVDAAPVKSKPWTGGDGEIDTRQLTPREMAVIERIRELIKSRPRRASDVFCIDERDWVYPKLAPLIVQEQTHYQLGVRDYWGLSDLDRRRKFWAAMERFCDRSNGIAGLPAWDAGLTRGSVLRRLWRKFAR